MLLLLLLCSVTKSCTAFCDHMDCSMPGFHVPHHLLEFAQVHVHWIGDAIRPSHPPFSSCSQFSQHQDLFQKVSSLHQMARVLEFQLRHQSFQWIFRIDFLWDWLVWSPWWPRDSQASYPAPQSKVSILQCSAFLLVQLSYLYLTTRKIITLTIWTFVSKVMSLFFNILCRLVIVFLPRSNHLISSLQLTIHNDFRAQEEICHCFHLFPFSLPWSDETRCDIFFIS